MSVRKRKDRHNKSQTRWVCDCRWPNGERFRKVMANRNLAKQLDHRIIGAVVNGTWKDLRRELKYGIHSQQTVAAYCDHYLEVYAKVRTRSWKNTLTRLKHMKRILGRFQMGDVKALDVDRYIAHRQKDGVKDATINRELTTLKHMFRQALRDGVLTSNPIAQVEKLKELREERPRVPRSYLDRICKHLPWPVNQIVLFIYETGCRPSEALALKRTYADLKRQTAVFNMRKAGDNALVALSSLAVEAIEQVLELPGCPYVFWNPKTQTRYKRISETFDRARRKAGLPQVQMKDFRHEVGRVIAESGQPLHVAKTQLGHSSIRITEEFYATYSPEFAVSRARDVLESRGEPCGKSGRHMGGKDSVSEVSTEGDKTGSSKLLNFQEFKKAKRGGGRIRTAE